MSSTIFYRFRSQKDTSRIQFDGTGITVFDLKKEIIAENKLGDGTGFELRLYTDNNEEYTDDTLVIPRSTSVIARRSPPNKPGKGGAARYVTGKPRITKVTINTNKNQNGAATSAGPDTSAMTEEERIAAMFSNQSDQWKQTQQEMASAAPVYTAKPKDASSSNNPDDVPPPGYMCYRCGSKDHWIKNCPTNEDPNWDGKRVKRTTGIPKTYLQTIEKPDEDSSKTYLMNEEGQYVVQVADSKSWNAYQKKINKRSELDSLKDVDPELLDPIKNKVMEDPVVTPCCGKSYSRSSIEDALLESDFVCPNCGKEDILLDQLTVDEDKKKKIDELMEKELAKRATKRPLTSASGEPDAKKQNTGSANPLPAMPMMMPMMPGFPMMPPQGPSGTN
ncbi:CYFA0S11e01134g1_1 [Cyberlindnera fabianii]|uniref:CYFA0S11e01134g1_1 n=1 Tax=Cyberlindnera fabianii TaxID=36022 RepID=A0A061B048_CYBFA|nr:Protein MPE1 [Cyberlindnera fabianii]CDR43179.1 CYFA0S11e01134g1_1 [Cyberlindnera fabianii]